MAWVPGHGVHPNHKRRIFNFIQAQIPPRPLKSESVGRGFQVAGASLLHSQWRTRVLPASAPESPARLVKHLIAGTRP